MKHAVFQALLLAILAGCRHEKGTDHLVMGVPFNQVQINDRFWLPRIETNRTVTIPASFAKCEEMGRMDNFLIAGGVLKGKVKGMMPFDDTDVYKIIEGASYSLASRPDPTLEAYVDSVIAIIQTGQEADGYLTTYKTIDSTHAPAEWCPAGSRWENLSCSHELYNSGHLFEAAAAHYLATGKTSFLDIAIKNADLLVKVFGQGENPGVPGHQIVETGLIKLFQITNKKAYLELAKHFLDYRGDSTKRELWGPYNQDHMPVVQQDEPVGHAVRALYMYAGMTDIASLYKDETYRHAVDRIWESMVTGKFYLTGGIGARHEGEAFGDKYELPNLTAYNETCAAIANVYWNYRMYLLHGDARYIDMLERSLYNGVISGVGRDGKSFFYPNPLSCDMKFKFNSGGSLTREPWFDCSCCPTNLCRFMPSVPGYIYARQGNRLYVNLFAGSSTTIRLNDKLPVTITQETDYPWDGAITITISPEKESRFELCLRIPGWAGNQPVPVDLYTFVTPVSDSASVMVNGKPFSYKAEKGYAVIDREWKSGDVVNFSLQMPVRRVQANEQVADDRGKVAIQRGPLVYCFEAIDNGPQFSAMALSDGILLTAILDTGMLGGVVKITDEGMTAIPYFLWNNRGANKMDVWISRR
jgi:DUF1680 family protein